VHKAAAVNNQPLDKQDRPVGAAVNSQPLDRLDRPVGAAAVNRLPQGRAPAGAVLKQAAVEGAVAVAALKLTLPRQAHAISARCYTTGVGIWACCAVKRKSI
jgi:hypothetical protein